MLQGINRLGRSWVGRVVVGVLFAFLIVSFAIWGIGDIFRGNVRTQVATVGGVDIPAEAYRTAYQTEYQNLIRRTRQTITPDQARALGLEQRVLSRLVSEATFDRRAAELGLAVPDTLVVQLIRDDPNFRGASGSFDRAAFVELLRQNGFSEQGYVGEQRRVVARQQLAEAVTGALPVPLALREAVHRFQTERRSAEFVRLGAAALGEAPQPTDNQIKGYFEARKAAYRAPENRNANLLVLEPATIAKPDAVSDADAQAFYARVRDSRFGTAERRAVQQVVFATRDEAASALQRVRDGASFEAIATERGVSEGSLNLGTLTKAEMFDPATAEAAFALDEGAVGGPVDGRFGPVLVRVTKVETAAQKRFEEVAAEIRRDVALERARGEIQAVHDAIEDQRAGARPLADIARERGLALVQIAGADRNGADKAGQPVSGVPGRDAVIAALFRSDVGADSEAVRTPGGGYVWLEVTNVEGARDRTLDEVRDRVVADWRRDEIGARLTEKARQLVGRVEAGEGLAAVAAEAGAQVEQAVDLTRSGAAGTLPQAAVPRVFATPVGKAATATTGDEERVLFKVTGATVPPFVTTTQEAAAAEGQIRTVLADDLLAEYVTALEKQVGVQLYPQNVRRAIGGEL